MKLIDLLVQELPKTGGWPEGIKEIAQDYDGQLRYDYGFGPLISILADNHRKIFEPLRKAKDDLFVRHHQYEAALAASQQTEWNGEGLPPVGCEVEFFNDDYECRDSCPQNGTIVKVVAHQKSKSGIDVAVFTWHGDRCAVHAEVCNEYLFRPIRTEAERKRDEAITQMMECSAVLTEITAGLIYDAIAAGTIPGVKLED